MLSVPKRLRGCLQTDAALQGTVLRIVLRVVERCLRQHSPRCSESARIGSVALIRRFASSRNEQVHFHRRVIDGVFDPAADAYNEEGVVFHAASGLDAAAFTDVPAVVRQRILAGIG